MEPVSLNGKWKCKSDVANLGIENIPENFNKSDNILVEIESIFLNILSLDQIT